ncbi:branched-chain amino acid ABC transporter permease [Bradyrhizobium sp. NP1]|uniref:branched-chain amino acid ABC transporter permease n=1 Tax=Bradyrhizobium sp. NP1 TaxID=3049772 RepID=UPI0025A539A0|nr:branched-chain amino acid ABC transporter permease [Bradyrhizobium sp. NP1]WJR76628.1 branched-chain amino acid ABC transporter permease [Bradyrhizobium sp. NP1]
MELFLQYLVNALALSAIYALIAIGISLFFGIIGVVNLAHGDIAAVGVFAALAVFQGVLGTAGTETPGLMLSVAAIAAGVLAAVIVGVVFYLVALRPVAGAPPIIGLLSSVGAGFVIREAILNFYPNGRNPQPFPSFVPPRSYDLGSVFIDLKQIVLVVTTAILVVVLSFIVERTRLGRATRSILNNREVALSLGVPVLKVTLAMFVIGATLAGIAGLLNAVYYNVVQSDMGVLLTVKGFTAAVVGGLGNIYGAVLGALLIGLIESMASGYLPDGSAYKDVAVFAVLIAVLIVRPVGLLGRASGDRV